MSRRARAGLLGFFLGAALIWALFLPVYSERGFGIDPRPPVVLGAVLLLLGFTGQMRWTLRPWLHWVLGVAIALLALLQLASAAVAQILDRPLDLYFDFRHVPNLLALYLDAAGWRGALVLSAAALGAALLLWLTVRALAAIEHAMARPRTAVVALAAGLIGLSLIALPFAQPIDSAAARAAGAQTMAAWRAFTVLHGFDNRYAAALAAPEPPAGKLPGLKGKDVYLILIESYGTVGLDDPAYRRVLDPALAEFASTVEGAGYTLLSSRLVSPVFGGGSWLAHGTLASGIKLDQLANELLLNSQRLSLPRYLAAAGYRTVEVMPGIKKPDPEAAFWGFDAHYFAADLGYAGPPFGWFDIPDQFTLKQFAAHELTPGNAPLFAQIVLVSSHTPFAPVPPYLGDWSDVGPYKNVPDDAWTRIYAPPNWNNLDQPYLASLSYDLKTVGVWLKGLDRDALVIILGDHQPPEITRVAGQPWTVPVYVLSRDADLTQPFAALGYTRGDTPPPRDNPEGMEKFLGEFLRAFSVAPPCLDSASHDGSALDSRLTCAPRPPPALAPRQSPDARAASPPSPG
ncbi:MAG TPA: sulfatase-like hydrolase/transferase [Stellaceae bacterium]|nr:sulfatase-like hydrolase/transferase [Stellaceae bacterium]